VTKGKAQGFRKFPFERQTKAQVKNRKFEKSTQRKRRKPPGAGVGAKNYERKAVSWDH